MGDFLWYRLFNHTEFIESELIIFEGTVNLEGIGEKKFLVTRGNLTSVTYGDEILPLFLNGRNPYRFNELAVYMDGNNDVWLGIYRAD